MPPQLPNTNQPSPVRLITPLRPNVVESLQRRGLWNELGKLTASMRDHFVRERNLFGP